MQIPKKGMRRRPYWLRWACPFLMGQVPRRRRTDERSIYLTFDDGPTKKTDEILELLEALNVKATFFVTGRELKENIEEGRKIVLAGHELGNHSYSHKRMVLKSPSFIKKEIQLTDNIIKNTIPGYSTKIFRFPGGSYGRNIKFKSAVNVLNYVYYDWDALNGDSEGYLLSKDKLIARTKETVKSQSSVIILMHDASVKTTTADSLPSIIDFLISSGYEFRTLEEFNK